MNTTKGNAMARWIFAICMMSFIATAHANLLTDHFGVTPVVKKYDSIYGYDLSTLAPKKGIVAIDDWCKGKWGTQPSGGEIYDVEALYYDRDDDYMYIAVLLSMNPMAGIDGVVPGDIAMNFGLNRPASDGFSYDYGVNVSTESYVSEKTNATAGDVLGTGVYRTADNDWYLGSPQSDVAAQGQKTNFDPNRAGFSGTFLSDAVTGCNKLTLKNSLGNAHDEGGKTTYVLSATILLDDLKGIDLTKDWTIQYVPGCRNDVLKLTVPGDPNVPEPAALAILCGGAIAMLAMRRRVA
jgi:hypothetical protein